jgi:hypothetical protein
LPGLLTGLLSPTQMNSLPPASNPILAFAYTVQDSCLEHRIHGRARKPGLCGTEVIWSVLQGRRGAAFCKGGRPHAARAAGKDSL